MLEKLRNKLRSWLGISQSEINIQALLNRLLRTENKLEEHTKLLSTDIAVDWGYKDNTVVIIATRAAGGHIKIIDIHLESLGQMRDLTEKLEANYKPRWFDDRVIRSRSLDDWNRMLGRSSDPEKG